MSEGGKGMDFLRFATGHEDFWKVCIRGGDAFDFARAVLAHGLRLERAEWDGSLMRFSPGYGWSIDPETNKPALIQFEEGT
jgi:hypothetical protein